MMRKTRTEMAGAWRSLRYDLARPGADQPGDLMPEADVTSTGMSTFGGLTGRALERRDDAGHRAPRRVAAAAAFLTLAVVGASGTYFVVAGGLLDRTGASAGERPLAAPAADGWSGGEQQEALSNSGMGRGPATTTTVPGQALAQPVPPLPQAGPADLPPAAAPGTRTATRPAQPGTSPTEDDDCCLAPPVPTPTSVPSSSASPTPSDTSSPSPSDSESTSPEPSADPSESTDPSITGRKHRHQ